MPDQPHYTKEQIANALTRAYGIKLTAARLLGCVRQTIDNYIERYPDLEEVRQQAKEARIDLFEEKHLKLVGEDFWPAIDRGLRGLGKHRGWSERPLVQIGDTDSRQLHLTIEKLMLATGAGTESGVLGGLAGLLESGEVVEGEVVGDKDDDASAP